MLILYHCNTSYASSIARLYLAEKKLPWLSHHIDLRKQEHLLGNYKMINPKATVPTLIDDGAVFPNSTDLMIHLEKIHHTPALWPDNKLEQDEIIAICREMERLHDPHLRTLSYANVFMAQKQRDNADTERVVALAKSHPDANRGDFLQRAVQGKLTHDESNDAQHAVEHAIDVMKQRYNSHLGEYMFGDAYTIVDVVYTAVVFRLEQVGMLYVVEAYPELINWYQRMQQRLSFHIAILDLLNK